MELPSRTVIRESEFEEQLLALVGDLELGDEFIAAAEHVLAHDPQSGLPATSDGSVWALPMSPVGGRRVTLFYSFDAETVHFLYIVAFDD